MNKVLTQVSNSIRSFAKDEEGAQIVEYALIIAVVSLGLMVLLVPLTGSSGAFKAWVDRVIACMGTSVCT